jgi:hypothetical protein
MKNTRISNPNPAVEEIMQAYLKTHMTEKQFETLVETAIQAAKDSGGGGNAQQAYDKGFSDGYDTAEKERA